MGCAIRAAIEHDVGAEDRERAHLARGEVTCLGHDEPAVRDREREARLATGAAPPAGEPAAAATATGAPDRPAPQPGGPLLAARPRSAPAPKPAVADEPPPEAAAEEPPVAPAAPDGNFTLDDVIEAWPAVLAAMKPPVRATLQDAQPIDLENGIIVFGAPKARKEAINERFRKEADTIKEVFAAKLGTTPRFSVRGHDFASHDALAPSSAATETIVEPEPEHEEVDLDDLVDAPNAPASEPIDRLMSELGAEEVNGD
jgi:hypothetical protein